MAADHHRLLKSVVRHAIPIDAIAAMERWYYKDHSSQIVQPLPLRGTTHRLRQYVPSGTAGRRILEGCALLLVTV
ncbi:MAG: hypothetical protein KGL26_12430 [Pseudomonadota bacterium]|nr:hypothetical protein [Pseudomonadota bacterium]